MNIDRDFLEDIYKKYNDRKYSFSDPISLVYKYKNPKDIEIASLIASSFAYGNVKQIIKNLSLVFNEMENSPFSFIQKTSEDNLIKIFKNFKYRFTTGKELSFFLINIKKTLSDYGSIENMFMKNYNESEENLSNSIYKFVDSFTSYNKIPTLFPSAKLKSPFKRFNLFLRWMIRKDNIDFGIWKNIPTSKLIIPLDTHIYHISKNLGITKRNDVSIKTAIEITDFFRKINPEDPVKYDFAITRTGILKDTIKKDKIIYSKK